jgi:hypothetical protein
MNEPTKARELALLLRDRIRRVIIPLSPGERDGLHADVCAYVDELKAHHWTPERVVVAVKRIAHESGMLPPPRVTWEQSHAAKDELLVEMVGWCIERYYHPERSE